MHGSLEHGVPYPESRPAPMRGARATLHVARSAPSGMDPFFNVLFYLQATLGTHIGEYSRATRQREKPIEFYVQN